MAFDGGFLHTVVSELQSAIDCHIDKIHQPSRDELVLVLRKKGFVKRLLISARVGAARIQFTEGKYENPESPPMFCMLSRKIFSSARLTAVTQLGLERVVQLEFDTANEMGDRIKPKIICELIGNSSNIILVADDNKIYDAVHRSDIEKSQRIIQPGAVYAYPPEQDKINILEAQPHELLDRVMECGVVPLSSALLKCAQGLSPLVCREIAYKAYNQEILVGEISNTDSLLREITLLKQELTAPKTLSMLSKPDGAPADFCYTDIKQYGTLYTTCNFESPSELLDNFYFERERVANLQRQSADIIKLVNNLTVRAKKRMANRMRELEGARDREKLRIYGELIKANIHLIEAGNTTATVQNFYDENLATIEIPLDPALNAAGNAARYFKEYKKSCGAAQSLTSLIESDKREIEYFESVSESIERIENTADIAQIRAELEAGGYLRKNTSKNRRKQQMPKITEYQSVEGYRILVGKNNTQNDYITTKLASKGDMWFHTKNIHGSHVVVMCDGKEISDETILFAARLAAKNSKASSSSGVPVDYTPIKYVKKPAGAKPGMVIYTTNKTIFVTPEEI